MKKDKEIVLELENQIRDINSQFADQIRSLDQRLEIHLNMMWEMQDYYKRKAEVQGEYAKNLEKLSKQINLRHKDNKQKRESWVGYSTFTAWQGLIINNKQTGRDNASVCEVINNMIVNRLLEISEDMQRIYKKCRDVTTLCQSDISKVLSELSSSMKIYHQYHGDSQAAENKLLRVQSQKVKVDQQNLLAKKFVNYEKKSEKKQAKYVENKLKALKARNEYILLLDIANAAIQKYFNEDYPQLVTKLDAGYHKMMNRVLELHASAEKVLANRDLSRSVELWNNAKMVVGVSDYEIFKNLFPRNFSAPAKIEFQPHRGDEVHQINAQASDISSRIEQIKLRIQEEMKDKEKMSNTLEAAEDKFFEKLRGVQVNAEQYFFNDKSTTNKFPTNEKSKEDKMKLEDYVIELYRDCLLKDNLIVRLKTKHDSLKHAMSVKPPSLPPKPKKKPSKQMKNGGKRPQLFGGVIEQYVEATGEAIPLVMKSCIDVINLYGMHHQGIFRVSGSVSEMSNYKAQFEKGEDPLQEKSDGDDINTVAGLLKLYLRELKEPLFTFSQYDNLIKCSEAVYSDEGGWMEMMKQILSTLSPQRIVIMRYLFSFLNHVTEHSDENMMEAYNLSICFGPTLIYAPQDRVDQHQYQGHINDLVKNIILNHESIFPPPTEEDYANGAVYEKYYVGGMDSTSDDDGLKEALNEEDEEFETREAKVDEDYSSQSNRELTVAKGDVLQLLNRENSDWWLVEIGGQVGIVPDRILSYGKRNPTCKLKKSNINKSTECLMSSAFSQSNSSLNKCPSQSNLLDADSTNQSTSSRDKKGGVKLGGSFKSSATSNNDILASGLDNVMAKLNSDLNSLDMYVDKPQPISSSSTTTTSSSATTTTTATPTTTATTKYQQILVPVLPPMSRNSFNSSSSSQKPSIFKKRNTSSSSDLDIIVSPPSPRSGGTFPTPPPMFVDSKPLIGQDLEKVNKGGSPVIPKKPNVISAAAVASALSAAAVTAGGSGGSRSSGGSSSGGASGDGGSGAKWNSLPHNIPTPSGSTFSPQHQLSTFSATNSSATLPSVPVRSKSPLGSTISLNANTILQQNQQNFSGFSTTATMSPSAAPAAATLPRLADKQAAATPPAVRAKPVFKKRISVENSASTTFLENIPQQQQQTPQQPQQISTATTTALKVPPQINLTKPTVSDITPVAGSTFLAHIDASSTTKDHHHHIKSNERNEFSSFKISSNKKL